MVGSVKNLIDNNNNEKWTFPEQVLNRPWSCGYQFFQIDHTVFPVDFTQDQPGISRNFRLLDPHREYTFFFSLYFRHTRNNSLYDFTLKNVNVNEILPIYFKSILNFKAKI